MTAYKTSHRFYSAWNYEQEIDDLNRASEQGWQLVKGGCFRSRFQKNPDVRYRYQLDFQKVEDMGRYIETFREQGWEYIGSTFNGWHYLRKYYDPSLPESAYEIFTDRESLQGMRSRWVKIAAVISAVLGLFAVISAVRLFARPNLPKLAQFFTFALESGLLLRGVLIMRNPDSSHRRKWDSALLLTLFAVVITGFILGIALTELRPGFTTEQQWEDVDIDMAERSKPLTSFDIRYTDYYYLDLSIEADAPLTFSVTGEDGDTVYTKTGNSFEGKNIRLYLRNGPYCFQIADYSSGAVHLKASIG